MIRSTEVVDSAALLRGLRAERDRAAKRYAASRSVRPDHPSTDADRIAVKYAELAVHTARAGAIDRVMTVAVTAVLRRLGWRA